jgi:hypothetical protein
MESMKPAPKRAEVGRVYERGIMTYREGWEE